MFEAPFEPVSPDHPEWGEVRVLPWDSETFGFAVGEYHVADPGRLSGGVERLAQELCGWAEQRAVEVLACVIDGNHQLGRALLQQTGFVYVDATLAISLGPLRDAHFGEPRGVVRLADAEDMADLEQVAERSFRHGRYHADARFPRALADKRYRRWMRVACTTRQDNLVYVAGARGEVRAFLQVQLDKATGVIGIQAVDPDFRGGFTALDVTSGAFTDLQARGLHRVTSRVSATNTAIMNLAAFHGFRFSLPRAVFHWHAPFAHHLTGAVV